METVASPAASNKYSWESPSKTKMQSMFQGVLHEAKAPSNTTFFIDSDLDDPESEADDSYDEPSPVESVESVSLPRPLFWPSSQALTGLAPAQLGQQSATTVSPANVETPKSAAAPAAPAAAAPVGPDAVDEQGPNLIFRLKSIKGRPSQEEKVLFRASLASTQDFHWHTYNSDAAAPPPPPTAPLPELPASLRLSEHDDDHHDDNNNNNTTPANPLEPPPVETPTKPSTDDSQTEIRKWSTQQVAAWMFNSGFENSVISSFLTHDISGAILFDLRFEDLRDIDVASFAKRLQIWNETCALRADASAPDPLSAAAAVSKTDRACSPVDDHAAAAVVKTSASSEKLAARPRGPAPGQRLEQNVPKPHRCSKGERCPKWRRQQSQLEDVDREHGPMTPPTSTADKTMYFPPATPPSADTAADPAFSRVSRKPLANAAEEALVRELQLPQSPTRVKQYLQLQHIVQQVHQQHHQSHHSHEQYQSELPPHPASLPENSPIPAPVEFCPVSPLTPTVDVSAAAAAKKPGEAFPPRFSSLTTLPKLEIPIRPKTPTKHNPSSSDSTIRTLKRDASPTPVDAHSRSSSAPPTRPFTPSVTGVRPMSRTSSASKIAASPVPESPVVGRHHTGLRLRSPASDTNLAGSPATARSGASTPGSATSAPSNTPITGRRPSLRTVASSDGLAKKRAVKPLPTLKETSRASRLEVDKSLPPTPAKSTSSAESIMPPLPKFEPKAMMLAVESEAAKQQQAAAEKLAAEQAAADKVAAEKASAEEAARSWAEPPPARVATPQPARAGSVSTPTTPDRRAAAADAHPSLSAVYPLRAYGEDVLRVGWVRRRRSKLWRYEWSHAHLRLTATTLAVHATARPDDAHPLELIDMDDYVVDCSTSANGKFAAAVARSLRISSGAAGGGARSASPHGPAGSSSLDGGDGAAFVWQLVPAAAVGEGGATRALRTEKDRDGEERTLVVRAGGDASAPARMLKTHNFAAPHRDERFHWMREVMLAEALRKKAQGQARRSDGAKGTLEKVRADGLERSGTV